MKKMAIIKKYLLVCMVIVLANLMAHSALSQTHRRYEEHEVIDVGNGMKIEVLKYRGEGENEECNVIYYTDKRQNGKRVWEKTGKIVEMERAAKLAAAQQVHVSKRLLETPIESTSNSEAEAINLAEEKRQQDERQKSKSEMIPKAVMKPNTTSKTKTTYTGRNTNLITAATQMLAANEPSNPSNTSARRRTDTAKITKLKSSLPAKATLVASPKRDSIPTLSSAKKAPIVKTFPQVDSTKITKAKITQPVTNKLKADFKKDSVVHAKATLVASSKKDSFQTLSSAKKPSLVKTFPPIDSAKITKAKVAQPVTNKLKADLKKDNVRNIASTKNTSALKTSSTIDSTKLVKAKITQPIKDKPVAVVNKDSLQRIAAAKKTAVKTILPNDTTKTARNTSTQSKQEAPKAIYPTQGKTTSTSIIDKAVAKPSTSIAGPSTLQSGSPRNVSTSVPIKKDSIAKTTNRRMTASAIIPSHDTTKPQRSSGTKTNTKDLTSNYKAGAVVYNKKFVFDSVTAIRVAVFAPLYIDDAFVDGLYNLGKANLPKNILTGLEFYNGVMMAIDSLSQEGVNAEVMIFDTRRTTKPLSDVLASAELNNVGLVIANITNTTELKQFSQFAVKKNIPLISATYPNTVGVVDNPFFVLLNSSFPVHLEGLYKHMQRYYPTDNIIAVRRAGTTEDFIKNYITDLNKTRTPLNIKWVDLKENFTLTDLTKNLDSTKNNVVFVASPNEPFGLKVVRTLNMNPSYRTTAIGMPTWDGVKDLNGKDCSNVEIVYSTPFVYASQNSNLSTALEKKYRDKYYSRPSNIAYKGFETAYHFTKLLSKYQTNLVNNLADKSFTLFNQFDIQPVKVRKNSIRPDYLENKKLYFIKKQEGNIKSIM